MPRGECKKFSAQRCLRCCLKEAVERVIFVNFNRLWPCPNVFVECVVNLLNQKLKNIAIVLSLVLTPSFVDSQWLWVSLIFSFPHYFADSFALSLPQGLNYRACNFWAQKKRELKCFAFL